MPRLFGSGGTDSALEFKLIGFLAHRLAFKADELSSHEKPRSTHPFSRPGFPERGEERGKSSLQVAARVKIVSFLPSATEVVYLLGEGESLKARSHSCDFPPPVLGLPVASRSRLDASQKQAKLHDEVWTCRVSGKSHFEINLPLLRDIAPDLVIAQDTCSVCALTTEQVRNTLELLPDPPEILTLRSHDLEGVFQQVLQVGKAIGRKDRAMELVSDLRARLDRVRQQRPPRGAWPSVLYLEWFDPLLVGGNWAPELIEIAGGRDLFGKTGEPSRRVDWPTVQQKDPDALLLGACGYDLAEAQRFVGDVIEHPSWGQLRAPRKGRAWMVDGHAYLTRSGPRLVEGAEILARLFHPAIYGAPPGPPAVLTWDSGFPRLEVPRHPSKAQPHPARAEAA